MLSIKHHFLFIHIPKTAGNSIQHVLNRYADEKLAALKPWQDGVENFEIISEKYGTTKHSTLAEYKKKLGGEIYTGLYKFTIVRNPWDRAISTYFYIKKYNVLANKNKLPEKSSELKFCKKEFIKGLKKVSPVTKWVCTSNRMLQFIPSLIALKTRRNKLNRTDIDFYIRYENLQADFNQACNRIGIVAEDLNIRNKIDRQHYSSYYDEETSNLVREKFRDEIEYFDYAFEKK